MALRPLPLRLLADDLTGALDSAATFATDASPVAVRWTGEVPAVGAIAFDSRTREVSADAARAAVAAWAPRVLAPGAGRAFKKIDSLLRGQEVAELDVILAVAKPSCCIIAPAFPAQGRITRDGRQHVRAADGERAVPTDLADGLRRVGHALARCRAGDPVPSGVSLWDARSDADLDAIVAAAPDRDDVLWVGSAGLAGALARAVTGEGRAAASPLPRPILGLIGSDHPVTLAQLERVGARHVRFGILGREVADGLARLIAAQGVAFVSVDLPAGTPRQAAAAAIDARFGELLARVDRPGTLVASGGETLRGLCEALAADRLDVVGEVTPGVARSILRGGRWDGIVVVSKSGAFGGPDFLQNLHEGPTAVLPGAQS
jgi:D-threonate/D-erythronate kinase